MFIKTEYNTFISLLGLMKLVTSSKKLQENMKVINFFVKDEKLHALSTDGQLYCLDEIDAEYDLEDEPDASMVLSLKELDDALIKYSSLQRTYVKEIQLQTQKSGVVLTVVEEPKVLKDSDNFKFSDMYKDLTTRYKLTRFESRPFITREIPNMVMPSDFIEMSHKDLQKYLDYMYPPMTKPKEIARLNFKDNYVCSIMGNVFGIAMPNTLPKEIFTGFTVPLEYLNFLRNVIPMNESFKISKLEQAIKRQGMDDDDSRIDKTVILMIEIGHILVRLKVNDLTGAISTDSFDSVFTNSVEVDKPYLIDLIKRIEGYDQVYFEITIKEDETVAGVSRAEFIMKTQRTRHRIPVKAATGSGEFKFMLRPESVGLMAFSHLTKDIEGNTDKVNDLIFSFKETDTGFISLSCKDRSGDWQSRYPRAPIKNAPLLDF